MEGIFEGVRVVELADGLAARYATMFLADHGADVVKLEPAGARLDRSRPGLQTVDRNKRSVAVATTPGRRSVGAGDLD
jgi:crotonobetainyl-CoA:carnitine CoA-transferase CaiB-like acyl-CoA transferase